VTTFMQSFSLLISQSFSLLVRFKQSPSQAVNQSRWPRRAGKVILARIGLKFRLDRAKVSTTQSKPKGRGLKLPAQANRKEGNHMTNQFRVGQQVYLHGPGPLGEVIALTGTKVIVKWQSTRSTTACNPDQLLLAYDPADDNQDDDSEDSQQPQDAPDDIW
jgi:hypothetical protein